MTAIPQLSDATAFAFLVVGAILVFFPYSAAEKLLKIIGAVFVIVAVLVLIGVPI